MMRKSEIACYVLASEIEVLHARDLARRQGRGRSRQSWQDLYDPHAATELGSLIYNRLCSPSRDPNLSIGPALSDGPEHGE